MYKESANSRCDPQEDLISRSRKKRTILDPHTLGASRDYFYFINRKGTQPHSFIGYKIASGTPANHRQTQ